eukprot:TRINITY_DN1742_c0_g1_i2.p1 TRINITY_DN1742_c0_g1~~TRINITY_DN1742_c0_g1_i2.p1  ORF type:complete len:106 (+),score=12.85 TRINITY_DN1742_c0_g1_i2:41-319(+)
MTSHCRDPDLLKLKLIPDLPLHKFVFHHKQVYDKPAVIDGLDGRKLTYRQLNTTILRFSYALWELGLKKGDVCALCWYIRSVFINAAPHNQY